MYKLSAIIEETLMGFRLPFGIKIFSNTLNGAYIVGNLKKPTRIWVGMAIIRNVLCKHEIQSVMQRCANCALAIVVINRNYIKGLKIR